MAKRVGLCVDPPSHTVVVLSLDKKSQIQTPGRTQPGLTLKTGRGAKLTHDYRRHDTTTLFAAPNVLDGTMVGRNMARHRHQGLIRILNDVERSVPPDKVVHVALDEYAAHKHEKVRA